MQRRQDPSRNLKDTCRAYKEVVHRRNICGVKVVAGARNISNRIDVAFASSIFSHISTRFLIYQVSNVLIPFFVRRCHFGDSAATLIGFRSVSARTGTHHVTNIRICFPGRLAGRPLRKRCA